MEEADAGRALQLRPSARYAHSQGYLAELATAQSLAAQQIDSQTLRHDQGRPIPGLLLHLARD